MFVKTLTADDKYSLLNRDKSLQHLQMQFERTQILKAATLPYLLVNVKSVQLKKVSLDDMQNIRTVC